MGWRIFAEHGGGEIHFVEDARAGAGGGVPSGGVPVGARAGAAGLGAQRRGGAEVAFTVAAEGGYSDLLKAKGCTLDVEAGKVPVTVHPVRLIIKTDPETPWAGDVVTYSLGAGSLLPPDMEVAWTAPNNNYECESDSTKPPTAGGGQFRIPFYEKGSYEISAAVCDVSEKSSVSSECKDCSELVNIWNVAYGKYKDIADKLFGEKFQEYTKKLEVYKDKEKKLRACLAVAFYQSCPGNISNSKIPTETTQLIISQLSETFFKADLKPYALVLAGEMDQLAAELMPMKEEMEGLMKEHQQSVKKANDHRQQATECIMSVPERKLCLAVFDALTSGWAFLYPKHSDSPCGPRDPQLQKAGARSMIFNVYSCWGKTFAVEEYE